MSSAMAPARWMDVWAIIIHPEVITVWPTIKMYQHLTRSHVSNGCNTYQNRIALVNRFQLHTSLKAVYCMLQRQQTVRLTNYRQLVQCIPLPCHGEIGTVTSMHGKCVTYLQSENKTESSSYNRNSVASPITQHEYELISLSTCKFFMCPIEFLQLVSAGFPILLNAKVFQQICILLGMGCQNNEPTSTTSLD